MIEHLDRTGVENVVMAHTSGDTPPVIVPRDNVHVLKCFSKWDKLFFFLKQNKIYLAAEKEFDFNQFDFTHAYSLFSSGYCAYQIKKKYNIPYLVAIRDTDISVFLKYKFYLKSVGYQILHNASKVFFLSKTYQDDVVDRLIPQQEKSCFLGKCEIIPNGIDDYWLNNIPEINDKSDERKTSIHVLFVGELTKRKNLPSLISAVNLLNEKGTKTKLCVVGKKVDNAIYEKLVKCEYATYHEQVKKDKLIDYYRSNDVFVLPSITETFGLVYAEAMSQGLPVIYTKGQGFDGQFLEGEVGYSVDPLNPDDIAQKIEMAVENLRELSKKAVEKVRKFSWDTITNRYADIYNELKIENTSDE